MTTPLPVALLNALEGELEKLAELAPTAIERDVDVAWASDDEAVVGAPIHDRGWSGDLFTTPMTDPPIASNDPACR